MLDINRRQKMKKIITLIFSGLMMFTDVTDSLADEVVFCVSQEEGTVALMDAKGLCADGESEYVIDGSGVERSEDFASLAVFSDNENCEEGSTGTTTQLGFDKNDDGKLNTNEIMIVSASCVGSVEDTH